MSSKTVKVRVRDLNRIETDPETYARNVEIKKLVTVLQKLSDSYYASDQSLVDDETYDIMFDILKERDPENVYLFQTGVEKPSKEDVHLPFSMPSLNKIKPGEKSLTKWFRDYTGPYIVMDKLDGISMQLNKDKNGNVDLYTKKQTDVGTSKKYMLKHLIPEKILDGIPNDTCIRGELVIAKSDFTKLQTVDPKLKNPRSTMSGLVNTSKIDRRILEKSRFIVYNILSPRYTISEQLKKLKLWGLDVVWSTNLLLEKIKINESESENDENGDDDDEKDNRDPKITMIENKLKGVLRRRINESEFLIDGIVLADDSKTYLHSESNPKYAMAFKMNTGMKEATVEEIIWEPTMYGYLQPVVRIKPVVLSGNVTVTYVTAHNAKFVKDNKLGKGALISIVRSGDVIPYIDDVIEPSQADMPEEEYMWNETGVDIIVVDPTPEIFGKMTIKQNLHFFKSIGVKFLSEGIMTKLYNYGYETASSIVVAANTKDEDPYKISGLGEKMVSKIYGQIDKAFQKIKLPELMAGSLKFGRGVGTRKIREILKIYPNVLDLRTEDYQDIKKNILDVPGFSEKLASRFAENLEEFCVFLDELREKCNYNLDFAVKVIKKKEKKNKKEDDTDEDNNTDEDDEDGDIMKDQKVVMTGFRSDEIADFIEKNGGKVSESVSKNTTLVIYIETNKLSSNLEKARNLGIKLMTRYEFEKKYIS